MTKESCVWNSVSCSVSSSTNYSVRIFVSNSVWTPICIITDNIDNSVTDFLKRYEFNVKNN